jgi:hypothetical protein
MFSFSTFGLAHWATPISVSTFLPMTYPFGIFEGMERSGVTYRYGVEVETCLVPRDGLTFHTTNDFFVRLRDF